MSPGPSLSSPFLLGFDELERALDRVGRAFMAILHTTSSGLTESNGQPERLRITLAVAGFSRGPTRCDEVEENPLVIRGRQQEDKARL